MATVLAKKDGRVLRVTLNRPEIHNAFNPEMIGEITKIFREVGADVSVRAVVLTGNGKSFCSGADLDWMKSMVDFDFDENKRDSDSLFDMFDTIAQCPVPVLARIHGNVVGGGIGLVAVCDIVSAEKETRFCFSEVKLGLIPAVISPFVLRKMPEANARELMLTAELFDAETAQRAGLVHFSGESEEAGDFIDSKVDFILGNGPEAVRHLKKLLCRIHGKSWGEVKDLTTMGIAERRVSPEGQEGLRAFLEKRTAGWKV